ncbi:MAG TPA: PIG-L family deacetylase [Caldilineaceae bacterium]|nr:PIG-L family deacetylase [Caldilineaceae bacterium]
MNNGLYVPERVMAIFAHPDDIEFGCAGTVARWVQAGAEAVYVLLTSGDVGIADLSLSRAEAAAIREAEQSAAAEVVGVQEVVYLREPDGTLVNTMELRKKLVREIRRFRPEVLICGDPTAWFIGDTYINHPDHRAAASAALEAVFPAAGQPHLFEELAEEGLSAHKVRKVYINEFGGGDTFVNISDVMDLKVAALHKHASQFKNFDPETMIREWSANAAKGKEMAYAESFRVITLESDEDWAKRNGKNGEAD